MYFENMPLCLKIEYRMIPFRKSGNAAHSKAVFFSRRRFRQPRFRRKAQAPRVGVFHRDDKLGIRTLSRKQKPPLGFRQVQNGIHRIFQQVCEHARQLRNIHRIAALRGNGYCRIPNAEFDLLVRPGPRVIDATRLLQQCLERLSPPVVRQSKP